jgi:hypothetical protein
MSIENVKNFSKPKISHLENKWDEAIADAKEKIRRLRLTIRVYKEHKKAGEVWPGEMQPRA